MLAELVRKGDAIPLEFPDEPEKTDQQSKQAKQSSDFGSEISGADMEAVEGAALNAFADMPTETAASVEAEEDFDSGSDFDPAEIDAAVAASLQVASAPSGESSRTTMAGPVMTWDIDDDSDVRTRKLEVYVSTLLISV